MYTNRHHTTGPLFFKQTQHYSLQIFSYNYDDDGNYQRSISFSHHNASPLISVHSNEESSENTSNPLASMQTSEEAPETILTPLPSMKTYEEALDVNSTRIHPLVS